MTSEAPREDGGSAAAGTEAKNLESGEVAVCPHCMAQIAPLADFCNECGAPVTSIAAMDPLKQVYAQGWIYRRAVARPASVIMLLGIWLIFGPALLVNLAGFLMFLCGGGAPELGSLAGLGVLVWLGFLILHGSILYFATKHYLRLRSIPIGHCKKCGYNLHGLPEPRCPECGTPFHPEDLQEGGDEEPDELDGEPDHEPNVEEPQVIPTPRADLVYAAILGFGWLLLGAATCYPRPDRTPGTQESFQDYLGQIGVVVVCTMAIAGAALLTAPDRKKRSPLFKCLFWVNLVPALVLSWSLVNYLGNN